MGADQSMSQLAEQVRTALETTDLEAFAHLLSPDVTWGAAGDPTPPCRSRKQVLTWYRQARDAGRPAVLLDVTPYDSTILVAMATGAESLPDTPSDISGEPVADRWQVLTVAHGQICDIRGYETSDAAQEAAVAG